MKTGGGLKPDSQVSPMLKPDRQFIKKTAAVTILFGLFAIPVCAGVIVFLSPLRGEINLNWDRLAPLSSLPADGIPIRIRHCVSRTDAWTRDSARFVDFVYVRRLPETDTVTVLAATHQSILKIPVEFNATTSVYESMCWNVRFDLFGQCLGSDVRFEDMRKLEAKVVDGFVYVAPQ
ncbi:MAG: hypothetical protein ACI9G1_002656 [Pirellulaceae bacterium]|jgi:hypothetical protein